MWIPVDPVARYSTLEFVAGSHRGPWLMPRTFMDNEAKWFPEGSLAELPNIEAARYDYPIIGWEINPGDVVVFICWLCTHCLEKFDGLSLFVNQLHIFERRKHK